MVLPALSLTKGGRQAPPPIYADEVSHTRRWQDIGCTNFVIEATTKKK